MLLLFYFWLLAFFVIGTFIRHRYGPAAWTLFTYTYLLYIPEERIGSYFALVVANFIVSKPGWKREGP